MSQQVQHRRGTKTQHDSFTGAAGEVTVETTNNRAVVHDGSTTGGHPQQSWADAQKQSFTTADAAGTADAITLTLDPAPAAWVKYMKFGVKIASNNTGSATVKPNGLAAKTIKKVSGGSLANLDADDLVAGMIAEFVYDGSNPILLNPAAGGTAPTKDVFFPALHAENGASENVDANVYISSIQLRNAGEGAGIAFYIPHDFTSIVAAELLVWARNTTTLDLTVDAGWAADGEVATTDSASISESVTNLEFYDFDVAAALTGIAAGDMGGMRVRQVANTDDCNIIGLRLRYS